jgi:hypothetical protein
MLGSSTILALWILAAGPQAPADSDCPSNVVTRASFQQAERGKGTSENGASVLPAPPPLPPDPAYDEPEARVAQKKGREEGIPGLPGLEDIPSPSGSKKKPAGDSNAKPLPPPSKTEAADDSDAKLPPVEGKPPVEAAPPQQSDNVIVGEEAESGPCAEVHGRPHRPGSVRYWFDGIDFDTWLDQGATINTLSPRDRTNGPVTFNNRSNEYQFNQGYFRLKRDVNADSCAWDMGGRIDLLYGTDSVYTESRGLEVRDDLSPKWNAQQYGLAMPQVYAEFFAPWGTGIDVKLGHFYSQFGYESVTAPDNFFYSHSYVFQYGEPFTFTGFVAETRFDDFTVRAGMSRGWDNWEDNNNDLEFFGGIGWTSPNQRTSISLEVAAGREQPDPSTNIRTLYSLVIQQKLGERWQYVIQHDYASEPGAGAGGTIASWYGVNQYLYRSITDCLKAGMRFEWFRDENGSRVPGINQTADFFELTAGLNWTPLERMVVRPELRWDWCGTADVLPYGDATRSNQLLLDCDVIVRF